MADPFVITDEARAKARAALYGGAPTTAAPFTITDEAREKARSVMGALVPDAQSRRLGAVASAYEQATPELDIDRVRQFGEQIGDIRDPSKLRLAAEHGAADRERLLRPFERGDASRNRGTGGAGLGLSIVRDFATHNRGDFTLSESPGGGVIATLRLPCA